MTWGITGWKKTRCLGAGLLVMGMVVLVGCGSTVVVPPATPVPGVDVPFADAGPDLTAVVGDVVVLDGTASFDPEGFPLAFFWEQTAGPVVVVLDTPDAPTAAFFADVPGTYEFALTVDNGVTASTDFVLVDVF